MSLSLEAAEPRTHGFSSARLSMIGSALRREVEESRIPGAVVAIARRGSLIHHEAVGWRDASARIPMTTDTIFSIASMTKPMTSAAIMMLHEEGRILLGDPVSAYLPELSALRVAETQHPTECPTRAPARIPTIQDLLRHTSGLTYRERGSSAAHRQHPPPTFESALTLSKSEFLSHLANAPLLFDPGTNWEYGSSTDVLGFVLETVEGKPLEQVLRDRIWAPLGMRDTSFSLTPDKQARYARALPNDPLTGKPQSVVHAGPHAFKWGPGGAAALSTTSDYLRFAETIRQGGTLAQTRILGRATTALMTADHLPTGFGNRIADAMDPAAAGYGFGLGFAVRRQAGMAAMTGSAGDFYWSGVYGTYFWIDPREEMSVVFMAATPGLIRMRYRQMLRGLVYQALS